MNLRQGRSGILATRLLITRRSRVRIPPRYSKRPASARPGHGRGQLGVPASAFRKRDLGAMQIAQMTKASCDRPAHRARGADIARESLP